MKFGFRESRITVLVMAILLSKNIAQCDDRARRDDRAAVGWAWTGRNLILDEALRPDLVIHYSDANVIKIIELTVPFETNFEKEHTFKTNKYATLIQDIKDKQISSELTCVEVGCRGYVSESNKIRITTILKSLDIKPSKRQVKTLSLSKLALLTSFVIFKCKDEPVWFEPKLIVE